MSPVFRPVSVESILGRFSQVVQFLTNSLGALLRSLDAADQGRAGGRRAPGLLP